MSKSLKEMGIELDDFVQERGWGAKDPKKLFIALTGELGELGETLQNLESFEEVKGDERKLKEIAFEMVDVLNYLMRLATRFGIDLSDSFDEKMPLLAEKYPVGIDRKTVGLRREEYRKTGKNKLYE